MEDVYRGSDILLNCSLHDSGCMVVLEAMSYGLPIITIRTGGPAVLADESCAVMIEPKSVSQIVDEICQSILMLKNDKTRRDRMSANARKRVQMEFMYDQKYNQIIRELKRAE